VLRQHRHTHAGSYTLRVMQGRHALLVRRLHVR
jgi:hypothetical protein